MSHFIYNISFHCDASIASEVLKFLKHQLIPEWQEFHYWHSPKLMRVHTAQEETVAYALHFEIHDLNALQSFREGEDPMIRLLMAKYPQKVMPFSVLMEEECLETNE